MSKSPELDDDDELLLDSEDDEPLLELDDELLLELDELLLEELELELDDDELLLLLELDEFDEALLCDETLLLDELLLLEEGGDTEELLLTPSSSKASIARIARTPFDLFTPLDFSTPVTMGFFPPPFCLDGIPLTGGCFVSWPCLDLVDKRWVIV